jgi:hypothetical protein
LEQYDAGGIYYSTDAAYEAVRALMADKITVNISNLYYDADYEATEEDAENAESPANAYVAYDVPVATVLALIKADLDAANAISNAYERQMAILEVAIQWMYRANGITNNGLGYLVTPKGEKSDYVTEFTALSRALIAQGIGSYEVTDGDIASEYSLDVNTWYCVTDYGIHIIIASYIPYDYNALGIDGTRLFDSLATYEENILPMDYIVEYGLVLGSESHISYVVDAEGYYVSIDGQYVVYDASNAAHSSLTRYNIQYSFDISDIYDGEGNLQVSTIIPTVTMKEAMTETIEASILADNYNFMAKELIYENWDTNVKTNEKLIKKIAKSAE